MDPAAEARGRDVALAGPTPSVRSSLPRGPPGRAPSRLPPGAREAGSVSGNRGKGRRVAVSSRLSEAKPGAEPDAATLCHAELPGPGGFEAHGPSCPISLRPHVAANALTLHTGNSRWQSFVLEGQQGHQVSALHGQARKHSPGRVRCRRSGLTILRWRPHCVPGPRQAQSASSPRRTRHAPPGGQHEPEAATQGPRRGGPLGRLEGGEASAGRRGPGTQADRAQDPGRAPADPGKTPGVSAEDGSQRRLWPGRSFASSGLEGAEESRGRPPAGPAGGTAVPAPLRFGDPGHTFPAFTRGSPSPRV